VRGSRAGRSHPWRIGAERIAPAAIDRIRQKLLIRRDYQDVEVLHGNLIAGLDDHSLAAGDSFVVVEPDLILRGSRVAVIVEFANRHHFGERCETALVVPMPMADDEMVDVIQAGLLGGRKNSLRVAVAIGKAGIDQQ
jgi:hypothetical protein